MSRKRDPWGWKKARRFSRNLGFHACESRNRRAVHHSFDTQAATLEKKRPHVE
jgi:hypothetical protein